MQRNAHAAFSPLHTNGGSEVPTWVIQAASLAPASLEAFPAVPCFFIFHLAWWVLVRVRCLAVLKIEATLFDQQSDVRALISFCESVH